MAAAATDAAAAEIGRTNIGPWSQKHPAEASDPYVENSSQVEADVATEVEWMPLQDVPVEIRAGSDFSHLQIARCVFRSQAHSDESTAKNGDQPRNVDTEPEIYCSWA